MEGFLEHILFKNMWSDGSGNVLKIKQMVPCENAEFWTFFWEHKSLETYIRQWMLQPTRGTLVSSRCSIKEGT